MPVERHISIYCFKCVFRFFLVTVIARLTSLLSWRVLEHECFCLLNSSFRSRVRQAGRSLKDEVLAAGCFESAVKRRGQNGARRQGNSSVPGAPSPMPVVEKEDNTDPAAADSGTFSECLWRLYFFRIFQSILEMLC